MRRPWSRAARTSLSCCLLLFLAACSPREPRIAIESPEAKISPTLLGVVSVFMKIDNSGSGDDLLVGARTSLPGTIVELHDIVDGKMVKVDEVMVPGGGRVSLRAARQHIMIYKMPRDLKEGAHFDLVLTFKRSGERTVSCEVTPFSAR